MGGEELFELHKSLKNLGQETRSLEVDLNEAMNQATSSRQILKHLEPDVQAIQGRKDLEAKVAEYNQCKHFRVRFVAQWKGTEKVDAKHHSGIRRQGGRSSESGTSVRSGEKESDGSDRPIETDPRPSEEN